MERMAREIRCSILDICYKSHTGHIGPALSIVDILTVLYFEILHVNPKKPDFPLRDRFILSKGHAVAALYATLFHRGFFSKKQLFTYCQDKSIFGMHPDYNPGLGIELTTGSLGHGLSVGVGMALGLFKRTRVYILVSDAELNEGSVWEAIMFASQHHLDNLTVIVDDNGQQAFGKTEHIINLRPIEDKWKAFGWETVCVDGHSIPALLNVLKDLPLRKGKPSVVIAQTISGKGVSFMEGMVDWHYWPLDEKKYQHALKDVKNS